MVLLLRPPVSAADSGGEALIADGATVNWIDDEAAKPLILAAFKGYLEIARLLLVHGADPIGKLLGGEPQ